MKIHYADLGPVCGIKAARYDAVVYEIKTFDKFKSRRCSKCLKWVDKEKERIHNLRGRNLGVDIGILL